MHNSSQPAWQTIDGLLRQPDAGASCVFPATQRQISLLDALSDRDFAANPDSAQTGQQLGHQIEGLLKQLQVFESISRCPILAITGILNAGKSSLLATYLSPGNRARILRGLGNQFGTHRFVLWLPKIWWEDPNLLNTLIGFLASLFGHVPERLSDDPELAACQYNGQVLRDALLQGTAPELKSVPELKSATDTEHTAGAAVNPLSVPLIAYDSQLDELRLGLLDCPDIQTGFMATEADAAQSGAAMAANRQHQLSQIGRLSSAFIVVTKMSSLHDEGLHQILTTLRDAMPGVPRMLAVNKIKARYAAETVYDEARGLIERFGLEAVFGAYDYRSSLAHTRLPPPPPRLPPPVDELPIFTELQAGSQPTERRYLFNLGNRLDAGSLAKASSRSLVQQLKSQVSQAIEWLRANQLQQGQQTADAWQAVANACYEFMAERDASGKATTLRLQTSPAIIAQMADSLQRTAPLWMRLSLSLDRTARQFQQAISNSAARFKILKNASDSVTQFTQRFRRGEGAQVVTPQRLAETIRSFDTHDALHRLSEASLIAGCETTMQRFSAESKTLLNQSELDQWSEQVWRDMSWKDKLRRGTQPLAIAMAPLLAVILVPFDGGGSAVLVFASTKELLAAAGLTALLGPAAMGGEALSIVHRETPWRQLSDLFAIGCDSLGLPRPAASQLPICSGANRRILPSTLELKSSGHPPAVFQWQLNSEQLRELRLQLHQQVAN